MVCLREVSFLLGEELYEHGLATLGGTEQAADASALDLELVVDIFIKLVDIDGDGSGLALRAGGLEIPREAEVEETSEHEV